MSNTIKRYTHCLRCGRRLKTDTAQMLGYGTVCYKKIITDRKVPLFNFKR